MLRRLACYLFLNITLAVLSQDNTLPLSKDTSRVMADTDADGIPDDKDECPNEAGKAAGCPDRDGDGVADIHDKCPDVVGLANAKGCPPVTQDVLKRVAISARAIQFDIGSNRISKESFKSLDTLVSILKHNPQIIVEIQGHTDASGDPAKNVLLSQHRAISVKNYLLSKGIDAARLTAVGYGSERPVTKNKAKSSAHENRRVEFKLDY